MSVISVINGKSFFESAQILEISGTPAADSVSLVGSACFLEHQRFGRRILNKTFTTQEPCEEAIASCAPFHDVGHVETALVQPLSVKFEDLAYPQDFNPNASCKFRLFLEPNEFFPERMDTHLNQMSEGYVVATGAERCFFLLARCPESKVKGLIGRDIHPKIKAYMDFNAFLFHIASNREDYVQLSQKSDLPSMSQKLEDCSTLSLKAKAYYHQHLQRMSEIYYSKPKKWRQSRRNYFTQVQYHLSDVQFFKIQKLIQNGNVIFTSGDINELECFSDVKLSLIDVSNIHDYILVGPCISEKCSPRIMYTYVSPLEFGIYRSFLYDPMNLTERERFEDLLNKFWWNGNCFTEIEWMRLKMHCVSGENPGSFRTRNSLQKLQYIYDHHGIDFSNIGLGFIDFKDHLNCARALDCAMPEQLASIAAHPDLPKFFPDMMSLLGGRGLTSESYLIFRELPGWKDAFVQHFSNACNHLPAFLKTLEVDGRLEEFKTWFGKQELEQLLILPSEVMASLRSP